MGTDSASTNGRAGPHADGLRSDFAGLREEVISKGLCTRCGGCVASCPVECLDHGPEGIVLRGECIRCGTCRAICPGASLDVSSHEVRLFGRAHGSGERNGVSIARHDLVASDRETFKRGYFGGRVSALLVSLLEAGRIDAALLTDFNREGAMLSVGSARIARTPEDVLSLAGSKYLFSPVLSLLRDAEEDPTIERVAIVCLPCHAHALRNMEVDKRTAHLTRKVALVIGLNCGAVNLDEGKWRRVVGGITGMDPGAISSVDIRKVASRDLKVVARSSDGSTEERIVGFSRYSSAVLRHGVWERCLMCTDYPCYLSDITFGGPVVRTERGESALRTAIEGGAMRRSSFKRRATQNLLDNVWGFWKPFRARWRISRRRRKGLPHPEYR